MNALALHATAQTAAPIVPIFSGARVELATSPRNSKPFASDGRGFEYVFVIVAELAPSTYAVFSRDNYHIPRCVPRSRLDAPRRSAFMSVIDEELSIASDEDSRTVALKPDEYAVWFQFSFEHESEYWGFLMAITQVKNLQVTRRELVEQRLVSLHHNFLDFFQPKVAPYNDPEALQRMRREQEQAQKEAGEVDEDEDEDEDEEDDEFDTMDDNASDDVLIN